MMSIEDMLEKSPLGKFNANSAVTDLQSFEDWLQMRRKEFLTMQASMTLDERKENEMFEWITTHNAVLGEVMANFRQATGRRP
jgi:hypothetical protein